MSPLVIVITEPTAILVQNNFMDYRGVRYEIKIGTARGQWRVAIYPSGARFPEERTVFGTRADASTTARSMIKARVKKAGRAENGKD